MPILKNIAPSTLVAAATVAIAGAFSHAAHAFTFTIAEPTKVNFAFFGSSSPLKSSLNLFDQNQVLIETLFQEVQPFDYPWKLGSIGTCGETVLVCRVTHAFEPGTYTLGLQTGNKVSFKAIGLGNLDKGLLLGFEDGLDKDYNDFIIGAKAATPEPTFLMGVGLVASSLVASRRQRTV